MTHLAAMIDLETLALTPDATIASIACVICDLDKQDWNYITPVLSYNVELQQGRKIDASTVSWWLNQSKEAQAVTFGGEKVTLGNALLSLQTYLRRYKIDTVWSKGADFDIKILEHAYTQIGEVIPWIYKQPRCYRTILEIAEYKGVPYKKVENMRTHTALNDAFQQLETLYNINKIWDAPVPF